MFLGGFRHRRPAPPRPRRPRAACHLSAEPDAPILADSPEVLTDDRLTRILRHEQTYFVLRTGVRLCLRVSPRRKTTDAISVVNKHTLPRAPVAVAASTTKSLGGNTKTVMCANAGPAEYNYDETVSTLRFVLVQGAGELLSAGEETALDRLDLWGFVLTGWLAHGLAWPDCRWNVAMLSRSPAAFSAWRNCATIDPPPLTASGEARRRRRPRISYGA